MSFKKLYWQTNYELPETMDGIYNAKEHIKYLKSFFELEEIKIKKVVDLGFGLGFILDEIFLTLKPKGDFFATSERNKSPVDICGILYFFANSLACVPLPTPGAPRIIIRRAGAWVGLDLIWFAEDGK